MWFIESSLFLKACLFLLPIAAVLQITGIVSTHWAYVEKENACLKTGLWKYCGQAPCEKDDFPFDKTSKDLKKNIGTELRHKISTHFPRDDFPFDHASKDFKKNFGKKLHHEISTHFPRDDFLFDHASKDFKKNFGKKLRHKIPSRFAQDDFLFDAVSKALRNNYSTELCHEIPSRFARDWVQSTRTLGIIGGLAVVASVKLLFLWMFAFNKERHRIIFNLIVILAFVGGGAILLSVIIFGVKYKTIKDMRPLRSILSGEYINVGWSYGLCTLASFLSILAGCLLIADFRKTSASRSKDRENKDEESKDQESKDQESEDQESKDQESKDQEGEDQESKDQESKDQESKDQEGEDQESKDQESEDQESKDQEE